MVKGLKKCKKTSLADCCHTDRRNANAAIKGASAYLTNQEIATLKGWVKMDKLDNVYKSIATLLRKHLDRKEAQE